MKSIRWEKVYLKLWVVWLAVLFSAIASVYFDKAVWAVIILLSYISYQLVVVIMSLSLLIKKQTLSEKL